MKRVVIAVVLLCASSLQAQYVQYKVPVVGTMTATKVIGLAAVAGISVGTGVLSFYVYKTYKFAKAIESGNVPDVEAILKFDSRFLTLQDKNGLTPLHLAVLFNQRDVVEVLLKFGADTTKSWHNHGTAEDVARNKKFTDIVCLLVEYRLTPASYRSRSSHGSVENL